MSNSLAFVIGTSRNDGNTWKLLNALNGRLKAPVFDLSVLKLSYYDYESRNLGDDFIPTVEALKEYNTIGFVSPMYWYTVSAQLKVFIDRLTDLLGPRKDLGRTLRGKRTFLLATGNTEPHITVGMEEVIQRTSDYLGMQYQGSFYGHVRQDLVLDSELLKAGSEFIERMLRV